MKYGVIDVGGGLRGIYGAGVLDRCLEEDLRFDLCIGVSWSVPPSFNSISLPV